MSYTMKQEMLFNGACSLLAGDFAITSDLRFDRIQAAIESAHRVLAKVEEYTKEKGE